MAREHGTRAKYVHDGCRCIACTWANNHYRESNELARLLGEVDLVDAADVRAHLIKLGEAGVGYKQAAKTAGVAKSATLNILTGVTDRVRSRTAEQLLQVSADDVAGGQYIDATETWANVQRLRDLGYPKSWIGLHIGQAGRALQLAKTRVTKRNADAIAHLVRVIGDLRYDERADMTVEDESRLTARLAALTEKKKSDDG